MSISNLLSPTLRAEFPLLDRHFAPGRPLIYLDSAATALRPRSVIQAVTEVMALHSGNVHRAVHVLGDEATALFEGARRKVARLIGAESHEVVLVRNTTEALNLVARCFPRRGRTLVSLGEHHSNLLPWGNAEGVLRLPPRADGCPDLDGLLRELGRGGVALVAASHVSNVVGGRLDVRRLADATHAAGAVLVLDAAQSVPHLETDVLELACDFLAFSGHKLGGPGGAGVLYGKAERLAELDWYLHGGGTVEQVVQEPPAARLGPLAPWRREPPPWRLSWAWERASTSLHGTSAWRTSRRTSAPSTRAPEPGWPASAGRAPIGQPLSPVAGHAGPLSFTIPDVPAHLIARALSDGHGSCVRSGYPLCPTAP